MNEEIRLKCDHFVENKNRIQKVFKFSNNTLLIATALVFGDRDVDEEKLKECSKYIEKHANIFSAFQNKTKAIVASKMSLRADSEKFFDDVKSVYKIITKKIVSDSGYLVEAAMSIVEAGKMAEAEDLFVKFKDLYDRMNKKHPILTSSDDVAFCYLLSLTDKSVDRIIEEMDWIYEYLTKEVKIKLGKNEIQGLAEVLTLSDGDKKEKCDKVVDIYNTFLNKGVKYGNEYNESASLGILIDLDVETEALVDEIIEVHDYIKQSKGFGSLSLNKKQRLLFATSLVAGHYNTGSAASEIATINTAVSVVVAEQVALMVCISASASAAASAH